MWTKRENVRVVCTVLLPMMTTADKFHAEMLRFETGRVHLYAHSTGTIRNKKRKHIAIVWKFTLKSLSSYHGYGAKEPAHFVHTSCSWQWTDCGGKIQRPKLQWLIRTLSKLHTQAAYTGMYACLKTDAFPIKSVQCACIGAVRMYNFMVSYFLR